MGSFIRVLTPSDTHKTPPVSHNTPRHLPSLSSTRDLQPPARKTLTRSCVLCGGLSFSAETRFGRLIVRRRVQPSLSCFSLPGRQLLPSQPVFSSSKTTHHHKSFMDNS